MNKLLAIISALTICFSLTACGDTGSEKSADTTAETTTTTAKPTETTTTAPPETTTTTEATTSTVAETEPPVEEDKGPVLKKVIENGYYNLNEIDYDENGNEISNKNYAKTWEIGTSNVTISTKPTLTIVNEYTYDEHNNIIEKEYKQYDDKNNIYVNEITNYEYSSDNKLIKESVYSADDDKCIVYYTYSYDDKGNITNKIQYDPANDSIYEEYYWEYDDKGNVIKESDKRDSDEIITTYEYDDNGNTIKSTNNNGYYQLYTYDDNHNVIQESIYDPFLGRIYYIAEYKYDENNNITFKREYYDEDHTSNSKIVNFDGLDFYYDENMDTTYENTYY